MSAWPTVHTSFANNIRTELAQQEADRDGMSIPDEGTIREYYDLRKQLATYSADIRHVIIHPEYCMPFMHPGRLVQVKHQDHDFGWGVVVDCHKRKLPKTATEEYPPQESRVVDILLSIAEDSGKGGLKDGSLLPPGVRPPRVGEKAQMQVVPAVLSCIQGISFIRLTIPKDVKPLGARREVGKQLVEVQRRFPDGIALVDPVENMGIKDDSFKQTLRVRTNCSLSLSLLFLFFTLSCFLSFYCLFVPPTRSECRLT